MRLIFVCGPARSGTSAVMELLTRMGASELPNNVGGAHNPDYHENIVINALAEAIHPWHKSAEVDHNTHLPEAMAAYILEHRKPILALKSPAFPFILDKLEMVVNQLQYSGIDWSPISKNGVEATFIQVWRDMEANAQSMNKFTGRVWAIDHWKDVIRDSRRVFNHDHVIRYEDLVHDWHAIAEQLATIPGLTVPEDGGIRPELNHHRGNSHAA